MKSKKKRQSRSSIMMLVGANLFFIVIHLYQYVVFVRATHNKQQAEKQLVMLQERQVQRTQELEELKSRAMVRHYAAKELGMKVLSLKQVKKVPH